MDNAKDLKRRDFLRRTMLTGAGAAVASAAPARKVAIAGDPTDPMVSATPARHAAQAVAAALVARGVQAQIYPALSQVPREDLCILLAGPSDPNARRSLEALRVGSLAGGESLALLPATAAGRPVVLATGSDLRGLTYAVLELADRVQYGADPLAALSLPGPIAEHPANRIRSITRCFVSDVEDKPWYNDRAMWPEYLSMLASQRFNRFSLAFGIGYDFLRQITDCYLHFAYPFLVNVPGYQVRAKGLPDEERDRNLEMLRYISDEAEARGLHFQLALWTHGYQWTDSPRANHTIEGLTPETHAAYCREALYRVLQACPAIRGVTLRIHGESGVPEGDYGFWKTLFQALQRTGRPIEIDMHAKGMDFAMIDVALATGLPVNVSPKYWAEHMGLPYHQAGIREEEIPPRDRQDNGFFALSGGSRKFLRYGYGDLLREDRRYGVLHRMWPGTQRVLLWGDPGIAAAFGRASSFCGSAGAELCEPLSFKGRKGSGLPGGRCAYADASLNPRWDWEKYLYTYRLWGRLLYNPDTEPQTWRRYLDRRFQAAAPAVEAALSNGSRILPLVLTAHGASGANNSYWPEMYANMAIVDTGKKQPYSDTPSPKKFGTVSPFDPELFARVDDFSAEMLKGERSGKISPLQVAQWLEDFSAASTKARSEADARAASRSDAEFRRFRADVAIESALGGFYAWKFRSAVLYHLYEQTGERAPLEEALKAYRTARAAWAEAAETARGVYVADVTYGSDAQLRGHWTDRLPAIDEDIAEMAKRVEGAGPTTSAAVKQAVAEVLGQPRVLSIEARHETPASFRPGTPLAIEITLEKPAAVRLHYRHANQAERFQVVAMQDAGRRCRAEIPAPFTKSPYPLQYYFEVRQGAADAGFYPALGPPAWKQPYFVVRQA
jgi:hypothetical protein